MDKSAPIGLFDSGVGGTTILKEIIRLMPFESTIYLADSLHAPYGPKGRKAIQALSVKNTEFLLKAGCKMIVVACNTATTNAIELLRKKYEVPFIGIEPAIKPAALNTRTGKVGVLATRGTLSSRLFHKTSRRFASGIEILEQHGDGLVELIETGLANSVKTRKLLEHYLQPMIDKGIDVLVLGCTHYPLLMPQLSEILPPHIRIIDSGAAVARQTRKILEENGILCQKDSQQAITHTFYHNTEQLDYAKWTSEVHPNIQCVFLDKKK